MKQNKAGGHTAKHSASKKHGGGTAKHSPPKASPAPVAGGAMQPVHVAGPWCVRFTRLSLISVRLDDDNLAGAFKRMRDQLSKVLGIDDRSPCIAFAYAQEQNIQAGVRLEIWGPGSLPR